jgi:hypothetical protein
MRTLIDFDIEAIDLLIKAQKERQKAQNQLYERPFLEISLENPVFDEKEEENGEKSVIEIDI